MWYNQYTGKTNKQPPLTTTHAEKEAMNRVYLRCFWKGLDDGVTRWFLEVIRRSLFLLLKKWRVQEWGWTPNTLWSLSTWIRVTHYLLLITQDSEPGIIWGMQGSLVWTLGLILETVHYFCSFFNSCLCIGNKKVYPTLLLLTSRIRG